MGNKEVVIILTLMTDSISLIIISISLIIIRFAYIYICTIFYTLFSYLIHCGVLSGQYLLTGSFSVKAV